MGIELCEPSYLYNLLNQYRRVSRLAEPNYLCLLDARGQREYDESHVVTARRILQSPTGEYLVPDSEELRCVRYCVVYDCESCCGYEEEEKGKAAEEGAALQHAQALERFTRHPVLVLRGGYQRFSASYPFLRTQKVLWMPQELASFQPYPAEILPGKLYLGNFKQACDQQMLKDLKIQAQVSISEQPAALCAEGDKHLQVAVPDSLEADLFSSFATICHFIDAQLPHRAVLLFSSLGLSRSSTAAMAYLMHSCHFSLKRAWNHVLKCKPSVRPPRGFVEQLSAWESQIYGTRITDVSEPHY
ncbi:serine/threonine/tyrosine-interacting-like protein 1 [Dryobates pubescens]|uniref:serine/threonine/tyrosine-interacting-like protein 1 n=1 Tax=Dryobates pubescens TaxID=118200 RepID=UPI0023BA0303|nr:serine/threonine/tyrosine-interacting-like protein 1 [Dryobates pubescens]